MSDERIVPWWERLPHILGYPAHARGFIAAAFLGVLSWMGSLASFGPTTILFRLATVGVIFTTMFLIIRSSADGSTDLPELEVSDLWDDILSPGLKATLLTLLLAAPAVFAFLEATATAVPAIATATPPPGNPFGAGMPGGLPAGFPGLVPLPSARPTAMPAIPPPPALPPMHAAAGWIAAAIGLALLAAFVQPLCFIVLAIGRSLRMALFPAVWVTILSQVFLGYLALWCGLILIGGVGAGMDFSIAAASRFVPILPGIFGRMVGMYFWMCSSHLLGWFVWQYHERLGYKPIPRHAAAATMAIGGPLAAKALPQMYGDPVPPAKPLPQIYEGPAPAPLGSPAPAVASAASAVAPAAPWEAAAPHDEGEVAGLAARFAAAVRSRDLASAAASAPLLVDAYLAAQPAAAVEIYRSLVTLDADAALEISRQLPLAKAIESSGDAMLAATAWRVAAMKNLRHPQAPRALFRSGECYAKAGQPQWARRAFEVLMQQFPMSPEAGVAKGKLKQTAAK